MPQRWVELYCAACGETNEATIGDGTLTPLTEDGKYDCPECIAEGAVVETILGEWEG